MKPVTSGKLLATLIILLVGAGVTTAQKTRTEKDLLGEKQIPAEAYYGVQTMRALRERVPSARAVVLTSYLDDERLLPAIRAGAAGYLLKNVQPQELARAVRTAAAGEALIDPAVAARLVDALDDGGGDRGEQLTPREREVPALLARGFANKRIAAELGIAEKTVKTHVSNVLAKLGVPDRTQAALYASRLGLGS